MPENYCPNSAPRLQESLAGFRKVPKTGVIYVMDEASKAGYCAATAQEWAICSDLLHVFVNVLSYDFLFLLVRVRLSGTPDWIDTTELEMVLMIDFAFQHS